MLVDSEKTNTMYLYNLIGKLNVEWCKNILAKMVTVILKVF